MSRSTPRLVRRKSDFEEALRLLCTYVGGDSNAAEASRLLRLPSSHNSKNGDKIPVEIIDRDWRRTHELGDLVDFLLDAQPIMPAPSPKANGHGHCALRNDGPIDVEERLAAMTFEASDGTGINATYCKVSPLLLSQGLPWSEVETLWVDAVIAAGTRAGQNWDRAAEVKNTRERLFSTLRNHLLKNYDPGTGEIPPWLPIDKQDRWLEILEGGGRPDIGLNAGGLYVRKAQGSDAANNNKGSAGAAPPSNSFAAAITAHNNGPKFRLLRYSDLRSDSAPDDYLVDELLPLKGLVVLWGKFKSLKTFWVFDLCLHIAKGWEYRDRAVKQGLVVYCAFEGAHGFHKRADAQRLHYKFDDDPPLRVMPVRFDLIKMHARFIAFIKEGLGNGESPKVIVLDTLNRSLTGSESNDKDMSAYIEAASALREAFDCLVIIIHHCGWDETRPRGHSALSGAIDGQLAARRDGNHLTITVEFLRDGPEGDEIHNIIEPIPVGADKSGKPRTSCIVRPSDIAARKHSGWTKGLSVFRHALQAAINAKEDYYHKRGELPIRAAHIV
jgi:AAA domain